MTTKDQIKIIESKIKSTSESEIEVLVTVELLKHILEGLKELDMVKEVTGMLLFGETMKEIID